MNEALVNASAKLTRSSRWGGLIGGGLGLAYGTLTVRFPPGTHAPFLVIAAVVLPLLVWVGQVALTRSLRTLQGLGKGTLAKDPRTLAAATVEASNAPDLAFKLTILIWPAGSSLLGVAFCLYTGASWWIAGRIFLLGITLGPLAALVTHLMLVRRSRACIRALVDAGLPVGELVAVLPPVRRQLRRRLVIFTAITVFVPSVLVTDVSLVRAGDAYHSLLALPVGAAQQSFLEQQSSSLSWPILLLGALVVALALANASVAGQVLAEPLRKLADEAQQIAGGALHEGRAVLCEDELWSASAAFMEMEAQLAAALRALQGAGLQISATSEQLLASASSSESGATQQTESLNQTFSTTEQLARGAAQIAEKAERVADMAQQTLQTALGGQRSAEHFVESMLGMKQDNEAIADSVVRLNKRVQQIGRVVEFIHEIADKSDLLALNAELEGTKAGVVGLGFSLVAAEMRRLAESVIRSTREIEKLIEEIRDATNAAVMATEAGVKATGAGAAVAHDVSASLRSIAQLAQSASESIRSISLSTQQQQTGTLQLAQAMASILEVTRQGAESNRQIMSANNDLLSISRDLKVTVGRFRIDADGGQR